MRVFAVLDGDAHREIGSLLRAIEEDRRGGWGKPRRSVTESEYFRVRGFKNGNAHLWFTRDDLVERANRVLADYYGAVLPDAATPDVSPSDLRFKSGLPARKLQFYPTPVKVVSKMLARVDLTASSRVLEPSAGTGNIARAALARGASVVAVEIDLDRCRELATIRGLTVRPANFLSMVPDPSYTHVLMNPPFYGTHWMEHVTHAFDFLAPGGVLVAVLPVSAELGETKKHEAFRAWAKARKVGGWLFRDLPPESFAESGTRVNTVILTIGRGR